VRTVFLFLALACAAIAQTPKKAVPLSVEGNTVMVVKSFPVMVKAAPDEKGLFLWTYPDSVKADTDPEAENVLIIKDAPRGTHTIRVVKIVYDKGKERFVKDKGETLLVVGDGSPTPTPPDPGPGPTPTPTPVGDLRVLEVHEEADLAKLPLEQLRIIRGPKFRDLLKTKCGPDKSTADGKAYWMIDKDSDVSRLPKFWQDAFKRPRSEHPYLHVFRGETPVYEGPLPTTEAGAIALITKHAEGK
jgi:hypothetical protein